MAGPLASSAQALHIRGRRAWLDVEGDTIEALRGPLAELARAREVLPDYEISPPQRRGYYALDDCADQPLTEPDIRPPTKYLPSAM